MTHHRLHYSYVIAAGCFGIQAVAIGIFSSYGVLFSPLVSEFGWSRAAISGASSVAYLLMGLVGIVVGRLNDRIGPRLLLTVTGICFGLGYLLMFRLETAWQLYLFLGVILGIGLSSVDVITLTTIARWFARKRGVATGAMKVGTGAGQMIVPLLANLLIIHYGWRHACVLIGVAVLMILVAIAQLMRRDPGLMGLSPDANEPGPAEELDSGADGLTLREAVRTRQFWTICAANLSLVFCLMLVMVHIVPFAIDRQVSPTKAAGVLSAIGGVSMAGRFFSGLTIDRIGSKRVLVFCSALLIAALLWLHQTDELWMMYLFALVYGIAHGGCFTAISPLAAELFGLRAHGAVLGIIVFSGTVGGAVGPFLAGYIFDVSGGYGLALRICVLASALGFGLISTVKPIGVTTTGRA